MEENNKKTITSNDKIPGCERMTRPEEISALSKYLGKIRETQEAWIEDNMPDSPLDIDIEPEKNTKLPKEKLGLKERPTEIIGLPDFVITPGKSEEEIKELPKTVEEIKDKKEDKIIQDVQKLKVEEKVSALPKEIERIKDRKIDKLPNRVESLGDNPNQPVSLPESVIALEDGRKIELPGSKVGLDQVIDDVVSLPDSIIGLDDDRKIEIPNSSLPIYPDETKDLRQGRKDVPGEINTPGIPKEKIALGPLPDVSLPADKLEIHPAETKELPTERKDLNVNEVSNLPKTKLPLRPGKDIKLPDLLVNPDTSIKDIDDFVASRVNSELYKEILDTLTLGKNGRVATGNTKLAGILSAFIGAGDKEMGEGEIKNAARALYNYFDSQKALLNAAIISYPEGGDNTGDVKRAGNTQVDLETVKKRKLQRPGEEKDIDLGNLKSEMPGRVPYQLSGFKSASIVDPSKYIRQLAEIAAYGVSGQGWFGKDNSGASGWARRTLLDTTIKALYASRRWAEVALEINKDRLPGQPDTIAGKIGAVGEKIKSGVNAIRNIARGDIEHGVKEAVSIFQTSDIKNRPGKDGKTPSLLVFGNPTQNTLLPSMFSGVTEEDSGLGLTLYDLCDRAALYNISTVDQLKDTLKASPYMTNPGKFIKYLGAKENMTLDTNAYWEVILEPLCDKKLNGGWSFLPHIHEINMENEVLHGINTHYDKWLPLSNLELQKSKLTSKTVGLYDGEISYPVSVEFTNELRMTFIDDQYKSWRRYFQRCSDVSVYSSEAHDENWYKERKESGTHKTRPTAIDKSKFCVAYYKNVAFRIKLYFMTPQYSTIKKFDLLCVLKDFSEEYMGEIDGGGMDLNISFSIVGENPDDNNIQYTIDSSGVGGWTYLKGEKSVSLGTNVSQAIIKSEELRANKEAAAANSNQGTNAGQRV